MSRFSHSSISLRVKEICVSWETKLDSFSSASLVSGFSSTLREDNFGDRTTQSTFTSVKIGKSFFWRALNERMRHTWQVLKELKSSAGSIPRWLHHSSKNICWPFSREFRWISANCVKGEIGGDVVMGRPKYWKHDERLFPVSELSLLSKWLCFMTVHDTLIF